MDREYTWIKCNRNFNGFYMTDYFNKDFEAFEKLIRNNDNEKVDGRICFLKRIVYISLESHARIYARINFNIFKLNLDFLFGFFLKF